MTIPGNITQIKNNAFFGLTGLKNFVFADGNESLMIVADGLDEPYFLSDYSYNIPIETLYVGRNARFRYAAWEEIFNLTLPTGSLHSLTIGADIKNFDISCNCEQLETITVLATTPPSVEYPFSENVTHNCLLNIPEGTKALYATADVWKDFLNVEEIDATSIDSPSVPTASGKSVHYDISGRKTSPTTKGLHIIRMEDGTTRKVIVK